MVHRLLFIVVFMVRFCITRGYRFERFITPLLHNTKRCMFSGIIEDIGTVEVVNKNRLMKQWDGSLAEGVELTIRSEKATDDSYIGCSIAVNGVCLTATSLDTSTFTVGVSPETLRRSNLGSLFDGSPVNIERALGGRNSGHFVQGHVDCTGKILQRWQEGDSLWFKVQVPRRIHTTTTSAAAAVKSGAVGEAAAEAQQSRDANLMNFIVPKGFICVDGTSLTVCDVHRADASSAHSEDYTDGAGWFTVMLVAHTQQHVIFPRKQVGDLVNIEVDIIGKLVEQSVSASVESLRDAVREVSLKDAQREKRITELESRVVELERALKNRK